MPVPQKLKRAAVLIARGSSHLGSGYYLGNSLIATCNHVTKDFNTTEPIDIWFDAVGQERRATLLRWSPACDVAILELERAPDGVDGLKLDPAPEILDTWESYAFPGFAQERAVYLEGKVNDADAYPFGVRALQLYSRRLHDQPQGEGVGGISGAPVVANDRVVGHFARVLGAEGQGKRAMLGLVYAVPAQAVQQVLAHKTNGLIEGLCTPRPTRRLAAQDPTLATLYSLVAGGKELTESLRKKLIDARASGVTIAGIAMFAAEQLIERGRPVEAQDILELIAEDKRERAEQLRALAFSLQHKHQEANQILNALRPTVESGGIRGGALKRRGLETGQEVWLQLAYEEYLATFNNNRGHVEVHYPGVNAATLALVLNDPKKSEKLADLVESELKSVAEADWGPWHSASYAEVFLLRGAIDEARARYTEAVKLMQEGKLRNAAVMRRQARLILKKQGRDERLLDDAFPPLGVLLLVSGVPLTPDLEALAVSAIAKLASERRLAIGYCSGLDPCAGVFVEGLSRAQLASNVFLPDPEHPAITGGKMVYLSDRAQGKATAASDCSSAAKGAAHESADVLDEAVTAISIGADAVLSVVGG